SCPYTTLFRSQQDTPHKVCALGHARLQQVLRGHERRHVGNVGVLGGHRKESADAVNHRSTGGYFVLPYESERACHPERRRREGPDGRVGERSRCGGAIPVARCGGGGW